MDRPSQNAGGFEPAPGSSLRPRPWSLFTLRPVYNTEQPPRRVVSAAVPARPGGRRRLAVAAMVSAAATGLALAGWARQRPREQRDVPAIVLVNGAAKAKKTPSGAPERWADAELTVTIDSSVDAVGPGAREAVESAFGTWLSSGAKLPTLRFETGANLPSKVGQDGKSSVIVAPIEIPGHKNDLAITIGYADANSGEILEADVILNAKKPFVVAAATTAGESENQGEGEGAGCGGYDVQDVVTHEAGHFFGLDEDWADDNATMFYKTGKCELKKRDLEAPDRTEMSTLYEKPLGPSADTGGGCGGASIVGHGRRPSSVGTWLLALVSLASARRRTRR